MSGGVQAYHRLGSSGARGRARTCRFRGRFLSIYICPGIHDNDHMIRQMTATEAKAKFLALLDDIERGEEIEITRHGLTVARLTAFKGPHALEGRFAGVAMSNADDDDLFSTGAPWELP